MVRQAIVPPAATLELMFLAVVSFNAPLTHAYPEVSPVSRGNHEYILWSVSLGEGLELDTPTAILQSRDGYIWITSYSGLVRFDGVRSTVYNTSNSKDLHSNRLTSLCEDDQGALWIGHETGALTRYYQGRFQSVPLGFSWPGRQVWSMGIDHMGDLWLTSARCGVFRLRDGFCAQPEMPAKWWPAQLVRGPDRTLWVLSNGRAGTLGPEGFRPFHFGPEDRDEKECLAVLPARDGGLWAVRGNQIGKWREDRWIAGPATCPWTNDVASGLLETPDGALLAGTWLSGLFLLDEQMRVQHFSRATGLPNNAVGCLLCDREENLWIGTSSRFSLLRRRTVEVLMPPDEFLGRKVLSINPLADGSVWIGTQGAGLYHYQTDRTKPQWSPYPNSADFAGRFVWSALTARNGDVWIGTWGDGLCLLTPEGVRRIGSPEQTSSGISAIFEDREGDVWVGANIGLYRYHRAQPDRFFGREQLGVPDVRSIAQTPDGTLWIGTYGGGLASLRDQQITRFQKADGLRSDFVAALYADGDGTLWIGTSDNGLRRFKKGHFSVFGPEQGLPAQAVFHILDDRAGFLWLGTDRGIFRVSKADLEACASSRLRMIPCLVYGKTEGLSSEVCSGGFQPGAGRVGDGRLWFPTTEGIAVINPSEVITNSVPPPVVIEDVLVDGKPLSLGEPGGSVNIPPGKHRLEFRYAGLSFISPERVRFRYRLEGLEEDWIEVGSQRTVNYGYLRPGTYSFHVTACNNHSVWNAQGAALRFTVLPRFWQRWWFLAVSGMAGAGTLGVIVFSLGRRRLHRRLEHLKRQRAVERERARIARDIHDDLGASLTRIAMLSEGVRREFEGNSNGAIAAARVNATARELMRAMDEIVWAVNPKHDTLDSLASYLGGFAQDFLQAAGVRCRLDVPMQLPAQPVVAEVRHSLYLATKEALHNVVKHSGASEVQIVVRPEQGGFLITVEDNGRGLNPALAQPGGPNEPTVRIAHGNGLANMQKRMTDLGGTCEWDSAPGCGTRVTFRMKIKDENQRT